MRVGMGHDTHRLGTGGMLRLGGLDLHEGLHLIGHSDADVLLHAITDALLGAIAAGDIGDQFPDTDVANLGRDSAEMLKLAFQEVRQAGYHLWNLDCTVFAERPKLGPSKLSIRRRIAEILQVPEDRINVKAKTGERVGPIGRQEAISAQCVVLLGLLNPAPDAEE
jgi:2-C-methyl-D-erythritol 2,4-cyclodiphosphate synthase